MGLVERIFENYAKYVISRGNNKINIKLRDAASLMCSAFECPIKWHMVTIEQVLRLGKFSSDFYFTISTDYLTG